MERIAQFEKVSKEQFVKDWLHAFGGSDRKLAETVYEDIQLPRRATKGSAGYDFFVPSDFTVRPGEQILIPTGVRVRMVDGYVLMLFPRSSLGFKYRLQMNNTVGIIDSDYYNADNEGHIFCKLTNDTIENKTVELKKGTGMVQGIFLPFGITEDDNAEAVRTGGFGSTTEKAVKTNE
ncbi:MAG: deoxyuridine 5'-triphosphate nucleotidohydrolase [Erysipelotrichaceae bacterium]|nr:deoxyuridine 5'-triphosphate nucleotidohydrolase [Erysipelotrichaceae bacterium]